MSVTRGIREEKKYCVYRLDKLKKSLAAFEYYLRRMAGVEGKAVTLLHHTEWSRLLEKHFRAVDSDFTVRHPVTGEITYWEHFGLTDEEVYRRFSIGQKRWNRLYKIIFEFCMSKKMTQKNF